MRFNMQTLLTVLTQNSRSSSGQEIAAATSKFDHSQSMTIWPRALGERRIRGAALPHPSPARLTASATSL
jgi:hypothetical protein